MNDYQNYFRNKKITVMGLGLLGRGIGDTAYLAECGADLIVTDLKSEEELTESLQKLSAFPTIKYTLGEHKKEDFEGRDMILVAPSVPLDSEYVAHGVASGARKVQSAALFAELTKIPIIGVTGTRGKSTTSQMIHHVLQAVTGEEIILGGTVRGVSNLQLLKKANPDSIAVFELDSWQLQGFGWAEISPQIAVFTNFMEDHMNYYTRGGKLKEEAMQLYFADKANIFKYQEGTGVLVTTPEVFEYAKSTGLTLSQEVVLADASVLPEDCLLAMPGGHNRLNAALAYEALKAISLSDEHIFEGLASFGGVEGRLQYLKEVNGVKIYNDNNATTPQAVAVGLEAVADKIPGNQNVVLIAGGADKDIDLAPLVEAIEKHCKQVVLIPGTGTDKLLEAIDGYSTVNRTIAADNLSQAVEEARLSAEPGDVILFSPGFASFGAYVNEYERNDEFMRLINQI